MIKTVEEIKKYKIFSFYRWLKKCSCVFEVGEKEPFESSDVAKKMSFEFWRWRENVNMLKKKRKVKRTSVITQKLPRTRMSYRRGKYRRGWHKKNNNTKQIDLLNIRIISC